MTLPARSPESSSIYVDPTAVVDDGASIGEGTKVWHYTHILGGARVGARCILGQNVMVARTAVLGDGVKVQNNVSIYDGVVLEDSVFCGPSVVFTNVINPRAEVSRKDEYRPTLVRRGATLGANATILCGVEIGEYAFIGAGAVVTHDVPPHALVTGNPARRQGWMCSCGVNLDFHGASARCEACGKSYELMNGEGVQEIAAVKAGGANKQAEAIPQLDLKAQYAAIGDEIERAALGVLRSQQYILGPEVEALEREIAEYCHTKHAIGVSSGTDALLVALMALGVGPGDEVLTTSYSFFATAGCPARLGARPVFVDIERSSYNIDPKLIEAAITSKTKVIIPVHLYGRCADMAAILEIGARRGIPILEDAAQAIGADDNGRAAGSMGIAGCFSFYPSKNIGAAGDAGIVTTNDTALAEKIRILRTHGAEKKYFHSFVGGNFRIDAIQAAILRVKLRHLDSWTEARRACAADYDRLFAEAGLSVRNVITPAPGKFRHIYHQYVIAVERRDELTQYLREHGIGTAVYYPKPLHLQDCFLRDGAKPPRLAQSEWAAEHTLALPMYPELTAPQRERVVGLVSEFYK